VYDEDNDGEENYVDEYDEYDEYDQISYVYPVLLISCITYQPIVS